MTDDIRSLEEESLISALMANPAGYDEAAAIIGPSDIRSKAVREAYTAVRTLTERGEAVDMFTVSEEAWGDDQEALTWLMEVATNKIVTTPSIPAKKIRAHVTNETIDRIYAEHKSDRPADRLLAMQKALDELGAHNLGGFHGHLIGEVATRAYAATEQLFESKEEFSGLTTGFTDLDELIRGMQGGQLITIGGRPGQGKTTLAMNIAMWASRAGGQTHIFSLEMTELELTQRMMSCVSGVKADIIKNPKEMSDDDWTNYGKSMAFLKELPFQIDDRSSITVADIRAQARLRARKTGLDLIVIDYLQLISPTYENRHLQGKEKIVAVTNELKRIAKDLDVPVIMLAQLGRKVDERDNGPTMADAEGSSSIEQDSDMLWFLHDPDKGEQNYMRGVAILRVAKHRGGPTGDIRLSAQLDRYRFRNATLLTGLR